MVLFFGVMMISGLISSVSQASDNAQFVAQSVPTTMISGQTVNVSVIMKNNGTTSWATNTSSYTAYFLGSQNPFGNNAWGISLVGLPQQPIKPETLATFDFSITVPQVTTPKVYNFQWQMVKQTIGGPSSFGALTKNVSITVLPASSVLIQGTVTDLTSHGPIVNTQVSVEIDGGFAGLAPKSITPTTPVAIDAPLLWGQRTIIYTDSKGNYTTTVQIPDFIPTSFLYAHIVAAKLGSPIYGTKMQTIALTGSTSAIPTYTANFNLQRIQYGAFITGTVQDSITNENLPAAQVFVDCGTSSNQFLSDNQGQFFGVIPLASASEPCQVIVESPNILLNGPGNNGQFNGISYLQFNQNVQLHSGQLTQVNAQLTRNQTQTAIVGRLTDAVTGEPVPYAIVNLSQQIGSGYYSYTQTVVVTDIFGRYVLPVATAYQANLSYLNIYTTGAFTATQSQSPYVAQQINENNQIVAGDKVEVNISLIKK